MDKDGHKVMTFHRRSFLSDNRISTDKGSVETRGRDLSPSIGYTFYSWCRVHTKKNSKEGVRLKSREILRFMTHRRIRVGRKCLFLHFLMSRLSGHNKHP